MSPMTTRTMLLTLTFFTLRAAAIYYPFIEYSGTTFFDGFDFYGAIDNTTWGNVTYVDAAVASTESLAYINDQGNAIIKVDNTTNVLAAGIQYRKSVRLTSKAEFPIGTLFIVDAIHMPFGCSVWPSIWLNGVLEPGQVWPAAGEIDWIEAINLMDHNQMALHSFAGCNQSQGVFQSGQSVIHNCNDTTASGCTVEETKPNSFGAGFNNNGGGAFGLQFDVAGVWMWFWNRTSIPNSISSTSSNPAATMDTSDWGTPSAAYPSAGCNITEFFPNQQLVVDITLCGLWAGLPVVYNAATGCPGSGPNGSSCFLANIAGNGSNYAEAYFELPSIRTFSLNSTLAALGENSAGSGGQQTTGVASGSPSATADDSQNTGGAPSGAVALGSGVGQAMWVAAMLVGMSAFL
ncbi:concanavalin A-like lectin/glucanase domain-containing protein [Roridomyces roridus]|uniref:Concanavalin A-like lectin/glucanase domain-containing protein n=1 Tax=Roridomyces roridus TaxID=1738132 RepID=A0AAD7C1G3_9AGAR|nr:concanavalin A-like lectin/glucanase domain-containing protein [Roridomyces roridus]